MRKQLRRMIIGLVLVLVGAGTWLLGKIYWRQRGAELSREILDLVPDASQRIQDFHRVRIVDGRKVWEVAAKEGRYSDEEQLVVVNGPVVSVFLKDGHEVSFHGKEGKVFLDGDDIDHVDVEGSIHVRVSEYELQADAAHFYRHPDRIEAPGVVTIKGPDLDIRGEKLTLFISDQRLVLDRRIEMSLRPRGPS